ncbi:hypothetical protein EVAR_12557_1 [Eumeta japonica]|uniref:Uncharacterized protein n=1 Tax=Eumeta variegata TaxID=151549 RepID=A0A4C1TPV2_EUMVA|nr:hypothetical protein EVAR_12557_1 [Eumeta japonica]
MDILYPRGVISALPATWEEIGYLMQRDRGNGEGLWQWWGKRRSGPPDLSLTGRNETAEAATLCLYSMSVWFEVSRHALKTRKSSRDYV